MTGSNKPDNIAAFCSLTSQVTPYVYEHRNRMAGGIKVSIKRCSQTNEESMFFNNTIAYPYETTVLSKVEVIDSIIVGGRYSVGVWI